MRGATMRNLTVNISFQDRLLAEIDAEAKRESRTRSELLREAARLYNQVGRVRRLRVDTMIAAAAILADARLATRNRADFEAFQPLGLRLA